MFSIRSENQQPPSSIQTKRENFRNQIRKQKLHEYKNRIRHKFMFDNQVDANILKNISLTQVLDFILKYEFPRDNSVSKDDVLIDDFQVIYDIQKPENAAIFKAIEGLFLHATSSNNSHMISMLQQKHIFNLAEILDRKADQMKPLFNEKSYVQGKTANDLRLPPIYQRIVIILAQCAFSDALFFEQSIRYIVHVINELLLVFPRQTKIVQPCVHMVGVSLHNKSLVNHLLFLLSEEQSSKCLLTRFSQIFQHEIYFFNGETEHSNKILTSLLYFYQQIFRTLVMNDISPKIREIIFKNLRQLAKKNLNDNLTMSMAKALKNLYNPDFGNVCQILDQTQQLFIWVIMTLQENVTLFKGKKSKESTAEKIHLSTVLFETLRTVFEAPDPQDQYFHDVTAFLAKVYEFKLDILLQDALKVQETPIIRHSLQLIKTICNWGDFMQQVHDNGNIIIKLFYFCRSQTFFLKKQAIFCICNIIEGYFDGKAYHEAELCEIYDHLVEKFDFLQILSDYLDSYADVELNIEILRSVKILCYFWQSDPELRKYNRFWLKFAENGGQVKLNMILKGDRNQHMKELAADILDNFVVTEEYASEFVYEI